ncbi:MAG: arginase family protein [Bacteroidales bacterium]|nr:arginase family protein [Bacteroidales bacterium]
MLYALDLSGALDTEALREDLPAEELSVISCRDIEGTTCYCDDEAACAIRTRIAPLPWRALHWIDSGDYHYLTALWCEKADTPFDLLLFDHHTDMQQPRYGEILSCGSWLLEMLRHNAMLRRAVIVGAAENLRCETLPLSGRVTMISEEECRGASADNLAARILSAFGDTGESLPLYISIDKDLLSPEWAETNWDQGTMPLPLLTGTLGLLAKNRLIIGTDICGCLHKPSSRTLRADIAIIGTMLANG